MLKKLIIGIFLNAASLYGVLYILPNDIKYTGGLAFFLLGGIVMGALNTVVKPVLKLVTFPIHILTVGLSLILLNVVMFWIFETAINELKVEGISLAVDGLSGYIFAGLLFGLINWVEHTLVRVK